MKAISVFAGKPNSVPLADLNKPSVVEVPNGRGVLVKVLRVGVDGTDKEINAGNMGPPRRDLTSSSLAMKVSAGLRLLARMSPK